MRLQNVPTQHSQIVAETHGFNAIRRAGHSRRSHIEQEVERYGRCPNGQRFIGAVEDMSRALLGQDRAHTPQVGQLDHAPCTQRVRVSQYLRRVHHQVSSCDDCPLVVVDVD